MKKIHMLIDKSISNQPDHLVDDPNKQPPTGPPVDDPLPTDDPDPYPVIDPPMDPDQPIPGPPEPIPQFPPPVTF